MSKIINILLILVCFVTIHSSSQLPEGFVYVKDQIPSIELEMRYFGTNNFVGAKVDGYEAETCILSLSATLALQKVQADLKKENLGIKIFDAYRPQRAVDHFQRWARNLKDTLTKQQFYPNVAKKDLFKLEYIATKSRHSSGSTVDVTIIDLSTKKELDMGSSYDFFGKISWVSYQDLTKIQLQNRALLQRLMLKHGFRNYPQEWWHFTLRGEPYKNQYFDFPVK
ncbi:M15 family metallopeptidase [Kordia sp. YSTF-M3]|uniref:D-alanyl-D-alanine dipeptidase n=1 Tax=Kordia aestuariivivens TaxID=2759037 RepID=A0ABR7QG18_9FLAO|nr:M15 family metallopeptidase [Kordia aestuariivivens]MBC8757517.1 M15 family metallopeptidase [Kordia aestuariivivens]